MSVDFPSPDSPTVLKHAVHNELKYYNMIKYCTVTSPTTNSALQIYEQLQRLYKYLL